MNYRHFIGIDVSKKTLDISVISQDGITQRQVVIDNTAVSLTKLLKTLGNEKAVVLEQTLFCLEPTGHYSNEPIGVLLRMNLAVWVAVPSDIHSKLGLSRGKNDKVDALRIAEYAYRFKDKARLVQPSEMVRLDMQQLLTQRELFVKDKAKYTGQLKDYEGRYGQNAYPVIRKENLKIIDRLEKAIDKIEQTLDQMIAGMPEIKRQYELLQGITGVGKVVAKTLVVFTNGFVRFDSPRALACHAGIAPFRYKSGTSVISRNKVSHRANKRLKCLLHMAALAAVKSKGEMKDYYERKIKEGKNKMSVLNAVRNKIIYRVFAVLKRNSEYKLLLS